MRPPAVICMFLISFTLLCGAASAEGDPRESAFIAELPTPGEFDLFANGGWDGNWYVGYDHGWISALPPVDMNGYDRVYVGARIGRAKTQQQIRQYYSQEDRKRDISPGPYRILVGVSRSADERPGGHLLAETDSIPLEGSPVMAAEGVGESRWFWTEIDPGELSPSATNYIHLWSPDEELSAAAVSPVLAGGTGSETRENSFLFSGGQLKVIKFFEPAIALKFVKDAAPEPAIDIESFYPHPVDNMKQVVRTKVTGDYITEVGLEINSGKGWERKGQVKTQPPYDLVFSFKNLLPGRYRLRCWAKNWWEKTSYSTYKTFTIEEE